jgi:preprotein translocase subunit SecF
MATHKPFRELIKPGTNFEFIGRARVWITLSVVLITASIGMLFVNKAIRGDYLNWTTDFKGGTEIIYAFRDAQSQAPVVVSIPDLRGALPDDAEVSEYVWDETAENGQERRVEGVLVRTPSVGALVGEQASALMNAFQQRFADREILSVQWSGDRLFARTRKGISEDEAKQFFQEQGKEMKDWGEEEQRFTTANEATGEFEMQFPLWGIERQFTTMLESSSAFKDKNIAAELVQSYAVGARAGAELRDDGIESLFYVLALIMLYLAFRFDIRYAPGAVIALLHDAIMVVGVFAVTWTEFSLVSVAALLTIMGYSVNDTVVIFDRIRENVDRLKDKKLNRIVNISINETLSRTLLTSVTVFAVTLMMNVFGAGQVRNFAFAMNVGVIAGVYSTVFIAAPVFLYLDKKLYGGSVMGGRRSAKAAKATPAADPAK